MEKPALSPPDVAQDLFAPIAASYERWARVLSMGQDSGWRRTMVDGIELPQGSLVLDAASGTGSISRSLEARGYKVVAADQSWQMTEMAATGGATAVLATAEHLPFANDSFDGVTFGYLLRYVDSVDDCLSELTRVVRRGGVVAMVEFGRPTHPWYAPWWMYTRVVLPLAGVVIGSGWWEVGRFLGPNIETFSTEYPPDRLATAWSAAGLEDVRYRRMSLGGGLVMWGRKP